jgi:hypothetical protein
MLLNGNLSVLLLKEVIPLLKPINKSTKEYLDIKKHLNLI